MKKYEKIYQIKTYEADKNGALRIPTLLNIFQDAADGSARELGLGMEYCLERGLAWVGSNYHIKINRLPKIHENIKIETWPSAEKMLGAIRDFVVYDENGTVIMLASSQWILIDFVKKRPLSLKNNLPQYQVISERALDTDFAKIAEPENITCRKEIDIRFDDIDINNHVNNSVYPLWASEAVDIDFRINHEPEEIEIAFKKECRYGERVEVLTEQNELHSTSIIKSMTDGRELARVKIAWKQI